jgi:RNA recognition motif-containing protein
LERSTTYNVEDGSVRVFVGNLAWSVTEAELMSLFQPFEPHGCHIITNMYGRSRGFGIVKFSSETAAQAAIDQFNESMLHDRPLEVRFDRGNAGKPAGEDTEERKSIFVGNLGNFIATDDALALLFQSVGTVSSAKVQMAANGRSKGWG